MASGGVAKMEEGDHPSMNPPPRGTRNALSCTHCRQRKVKCDKVYPCQHCQRSNLTCVFPERAKHPRRKRDGHKASNDELLSRLRRMEELIVKIEGGKDEAAAPALSPAASTLPRQDSLPRSQSRSSHPSRSPSIPNEGADHPEDSLNRFMGNSFLRTLTTEVEGLKQFMEEDSDEEDSTTQKSTSDAQTPQSAAVFGSTLTAPKDLRLLHPSPTQISQLCSLFIENVDPVFKVVHVPTLRDMVTDAISNVDNIPSGTYVEALLFAMYYAAVTSLTPEECLQMFHDGKESLLARFKAGTERAFSNADFLCECDLETLQALAIFLVAERANDDTMYPWTMLAVAVRLGHSLGLHREGSRPGITPFTQELRRRLWWQLIVLDVRGAEDVGTDPLIMESSFNTRRPANINDSDMSPGSVEPILERQGFSELTKVSLSHDVAFAVWRLGYVPPPKSDDVPLEKTPAEKLQLLAETEERIYTQILVYCDPSIPIAWTVSVVAQLIIRRLRLAVYHPPQHNSRPRERPQVPKETLLATAVECMEFAHLLDTDPIATRWRWFFKTYVQWHALAATLAELCHQTKGPLVERAWRMVDVVFDDWATRIADSPNGMLWRPIKKLKNRAQVVRNEAHLSSMNLNNADLLQQQQQQQQQKQQRQLSLPYFGTPAVTKLQIPSVGMSIPQDPFSTMYNSSQLSQTFPMGSGSTFPPNDVSVMDHDLLSADPSGSINWSEWDQFMQDFQMEDPMTQAHANPANQGENKSFEDWMQ